MKTNDIIHEFEWLITRADKIGHGEISFTMRVRQGRVAQILRTTTESHLIDDWHGATKGYKGSTAGDGNKGDHNGQ